MQVKGPMGELIERAYVCVIVGRSTLLRVSASGEKFSQMKVVDFEGTVEAGYQEETLKLKKQVETKREKEDSRERRIRNDITQEVVAGIKETERDAKSTAQ